MSTQISKVADLIAIAVTEALNLRRKQRREDEEATRGEISHLDFLAQLHRTLAPSLYWEIGVRHGASLSLALGPAVGIDPAPEITAALRPDTQLVRETSDVFLARQIALAASRPEAWRAPDLIFIDGMHLFENVLRDFTNAERLAHPATLIVIDDVLPVHPAQASRERRTRVWTGDVWKLKPCLRHHRPELRLLTIDTDPTGLLLVSGLDPASRILAERSEAILAAADPEAPPREVLARKGVVSPRSPAVARLMEALKAARP